MCGAYFNGFVPTGGGYCLLCRLCTGRIDRDAASSPPNDLDSSEDVSRCVSMDMMSKPTRFNPTPMYGASFDVFTPSLGGYCVHKVATSKVGLERDVVAF